MTTEAKATDTTQTDAAALAAAEAAKAIDTKETTETKDVGQKEATSLMDEATAEEKEAQAVEEKRLLEAKDEDLSDEDKVKKTELTKAKEEAAKANVVPEKYEFKVPEGMTLDQGLVDKITPILKEGKVSQATAQKIADAYADIVKEGQAKYEGAQKANFESFVEGLKKETMTALGANAKQELAFAAKSRDRLASPELIKKLNESGLANDIDVVQHFIKIGKAISEGKLVEGKSGGMGEANPLDILYPKTVKK